MITTDEIRQSFIQFFKAKGHQEVDSSSLVPTNDETLLFTNAGMVQFKEFFLNPYNAPYKRAVSIQKCIRAGGKHNDLENVGYTARHHTFFEMLGNFSFGNYFKYDAIVYAWEFLTKKLNIPKEKLWITIFEEDQESERIWIQKIGINPQRLSKISTKDNFWSMGDTGPCGPCTEIFYDHGEKFSGNPPSRESDGGDRYVEIWNLVFIQYNCSSDGVLEKLSNPSVDTGMGLERITAVLQHVHNNYDIDVFKKIISQISQVLLIKNLFHPSLKVLGDHIRACSFLITDGILPSNEGRGYVLRRIIRRAVRHGYQLSASKATFFYKLVNILVLIMGNAYPELREKENLIMNILKDEEEKFKKTLSYGMKILEEAIISNVENNVISGETVFKLYDTYGFPADLTADIARERGFTINEEDFIHCMNKQKIRAKSNNKFRINYDNKINTQLVTSFIRNCNVLSNICILEMYDNDNMALDILTAGKEGKIILNKTPFYSEGGGQVSDKGIIQTSNSKFAVYDVQKSGQASLHIGKVLKGKFCLKSQVNAEISNLRKDISANHTATHLLHAALRKIVGFHVEQKGSLVEHNKLRFDFSNPSAVTIKQLKDVGRLVNDVIRQNIPISVIHTSMEEAKKIGAIAYFEDRYEDENKIRVLKIGKFSVELCGGTHVDRTGDIGFFKIISESGVASGIRRIEGVTGAFVEEHIEEKEETLTTIYELLKSNNDNVLDKLLKLQNKAKTQDKIIKSLKKQTSSCEQDFFKEKKIRDISLISATLPNVDMSILRSKIDQYKEKKEKLVIVLATESKGKAQIAVGVSKDIINIIKANELANFIGKQVCGRGGGRFDMAEAGGNCPQKLSEAINSVFLWIKERL